MGQAHAGIFCLSPHGNATLKPQRLTGITAALRA